MRASLIGIGITACITAQAAWAQDATYIQIEAQPSLSRAEDRVRDYDSYLENVNGFALGGGWYGIALGPFSDRRAAEARLRQLRAEGQIPRDSYLEEEGRYRQRIYPDGTQEAAPAPAPEPVETAEAATDGASSEAPARPREDPEARPEDLAQESPAEARASESRLSREERAELQVALAWAGHYDGPIDAAFGAGTRGAMQSWQSANNVEPTGVLTTRQRAELIRQYNAPLEGLGLETVTDDRAGIRIDLPRGVVGFEAAEAPFVRYEPEGAEGEALGARVLLISQPGDRGALAALYEIMQTLEIVPPEGERARRGDGFTLTGANDRIVSHTEARLVDGAIKGFTLVWPAGDEKRRERVLARMQESFAPLPGTVLEAAPLSDAGPQIDLVAGLQIRRPLVTATGFYVDRSGTVATAAGNVAECGRITLDETHEARVAERDAELGAALLRSEADLAPRRVAGLRRSAPSRDAEVAVAGFSFGGLLNAPTLTYGSVADLSGLDGEAHVHRLALATRAGDAGGPVLDAAGGVSGMLLPRAEGNRQLPEGVSFALDAEALAAMLDRAGIDVAGAEGGTPLAPEDLARAATEMTVLVSCWE
ncbi:trypsin-like peptidase domain-containing protein [Roseivivax sp. CAU 1761]